MPCHPHHPRFLASRRVTKLNEPALAIHSRRSKQMTEIPQEAPRIPPPASLASLKMPHATLSRQASQLFQDCEALSVPSSKLGPCQNVPKWHHPMARLLRFLHWKTGHPHALSASSMKASHRSSCRWQDTRCMYVCVCVPVTGPGEELQAGDSCKSQELDSPPYQLTNVLFAAGACRASAGRRFQIVQPLAFQGHRIFNRNLHVSVSVGCVPDVDAHMLLVATFQKRS